MLSTPADKYLCISLIPEWWGWGDPGVYHHPNTRWQHRPQFRACKSILACDTWYHRGVTITLVLKQLDVWNHTTSLPNCFIVVCVCTPCLSSLLPQKYVRAHFNYSPKTDDEIPCQPLGLRFEKGDILEISNQDDPDWWQVIHVVIMPTVLFSGIVAFWAIHTVRIPLFSNYCTHALVIIKTEWFNVFCILFTVGVVLLVCRLERYLMTAQRVCLAWFQPDIASNSQSTNTHLPLILTTLFREFLHYQTL